MRLDVLCEILNLAQQTTNDHGSEAINDERDLCENVPMLASSALATVVYGDRLRVVCARVLGENAQQRAQLQPPVSALSVES